MTVSEPSVVTVTAVLRLVTPHAYFYVEDGADVSEEDLEKAGRDFEESVYPAIVANFGPAWTPHSPYTKRGLEYSDGQLTVPLLRLTVRIRGAPTRSGAIS